MKRFIVCTVITIFFLSTPVTAQMGNKMMVENQKTEDQRKMTGSQKTTVNRNMNSNMMNDDRSTTVEEVMSSRQQVMRSDDGTVLMLIHDMMPIMEMMHEMMRIQFSMIQGMYSMGQNEHMETLSDMMTRMDLMMADMSRRTQN